MRVCRSEIAYARTISGGRAVDRKTAVKHAKKDNVNTDILPVLLLANCRAMATQPAKQHSADHNKAIP